MTNNFLCENCPLEDCFRYIFIRFIAPAEKKMYRTQFGSSSGREELGLRYLYLYNGYNTLMSLICFEDEKMLSCEFDRSCTGS